MPKETSLASEFRNIVEWKLKHKQAVIFKHTEQFTHGVPDYSATVGERTIWWETKVADEDLKVTYRPGQKQTLPLMKNCFVVVFFREAGRLVYTYCFSPSSLGLVEDFSFLLAQEPFLKYRTKADCMSAAAGEIASRL